MFKFRLAGILSLREYEEKLRRDRVGICQHNLSLAEQKENEIIRDIIRMDDEMKRLQEGRIVLPDLIFSDNYRRYLRELLLRQKEIVADRKKELEEARSRFFEAMKERKALQKLEEKKYQQYLYEQNRLEQVMLDELAGHGDKYSAGCV